MITVFIHNDIKKQIQYLFAAGGQSQKTAEKCKALIYDIKNTKTPLVEIEKYPITNHGETRIKHCVKYDLPGYCRLVTIQDNGWLILLYLGTHDDVDKWLNTNKGLTIAVTDPQKGLFEILISDDIQDPKARINPIPDYSSSFLFEKLKQYWELLTEGLPSLIKKQLQKLETISEEDEILEIAEAVVDKSKQELIFDVFMALRGGLVDEAKNRILKYQDELKLLSEIPIADVSKVSSNDQYLNLDDLDADDMNILMSNKNWLEWMLFMHPAQKQIVDKDFSGSARLLGVSGSGKTCIVVRRAVRLARKYPNEKILILTLNESLAKLIDSLVDKLLECNEDSNLKNQITVKSFWQICKELLIEQRKGKFDSRILGPKTDKYEESIDEIWEEFYKCENNNDDANILFSIHQSILARGVYPLEYIRQEFDWIRSFLANDSLNDYISVSRDNRAIQFMELDRRSILEGLEGWSKKMSAVGAIDYLGLANELYKYIDEIKTNYRSILVDEIQDFGTLELSIIRKLVDKQENDLFLCGDIAQQVYIKHHQIRNAGILILPDAYMKILKNYRNSREILSASYELFKNNIDESKFKTEDFEILNPEFANFSTPKPFLRKGISLNNEFMSALNYLKEILNDKEKACIAICDYTIFEMEKLGQLLGIPVLDGSIGISDEKIYLSDLEQTKGFEFDRMIVLNVSESIFPSPLYPQEEIYREISKFYVAMTRAKKELILSYSNAPSKLFDNCKSNFYEDEWNSSLNSNIENFELPIRGKYHISNQLSINMNAKKFLYHRRAVGLSKELQNKLLELVNGKTVYEKNKRVGWLNMNEFRNEFLTSKDIPHLYKLFGPTVYKELSQYLKNTMF
jgi:superfamily I DNA/RNA helicase